MKRAWFALLLSTVVSGCHVVDRAERCGRLASVVKKAAPEIAKVTLPDSPPAASLREKAQLYGQLAESLGKVHFKDQSVEVENKALVLSIVNLERHLLEAAQAVEAQEKFIERQSRMLERHEEILAQKAGYAAKQEPTGPDPTAQPQHTSTKPAEGSEEKGTARVPRGLPGFFDRAREKADPGAFASPTPAARLSPHTYSYERAKRAAESASRAVESASRNLESLCR